VEKKILAINSGDQIRIVGKLVNVHALANWKLQKFENSDLSWDTSVSRDDTWAGACEVIFVEDVEILKRGNPIYQFLFTLSIWGIGFLILYKMIAWHLFFKTREPRK
jgi:hypothetical protein